MSVYTTTTKKHMWKEQPLSPLHGYDAKERFFLTETKITGLCSSSLCKKKKQRKGGVFFLPDADRFVALMLMKKTWVSDKGVFP